MALDDHDRPDPPFDLVRAWLAKPDGPDKPNFFTWLSRYVEPEEIIKLQAEAIKALPGPGEQRPKLVHEALVQKETKTCVELAVLYPIALRRHANDTDHTILLTPRSPNDPDYPGQSGLVGSYLLGHEHPLGAVRRIMADKLRLVIDDFVSIEEVETRLKETKRGPEVGIVFACMLGSGKRDYVPFPGRWERMSELNTGSMMAHHVDMAYAVRAYLWKKAHTLTL